MKRGRDLGRCLGFQIKHIGDFLHTLPALGFLKDHCPGGAPDLVISPKMADLALAHPWVNHCLILDRQKGWGHFRQVISEMRGRGYSSSFVFDGQDRSIAAAFLGGVKKRIGATGLYLCEAGVVFSILMTWKFATAGGGRWPPRPRGR